MGILDIVLLICFIPAIVDGISKGFVRQVISMASIVIGAWLAFKFSSVLCEWLCKYITLDAKVLNIISFGIIVILTILLLNLLGTLLTKVIKIATLGWLNRILGVIFALAKTALILGLIIMVFNGINDKFSIVKPEKFADARIYSALRTFATNVFPYLKCLVTGTQNA